MKGLFDTLLVTSIMLLIAGTIAFPFIWWGGIIYVLWHFVMKLW